MIDVTDTPVSAHRTKSSITASGKAPAEDAKPIFRGGSSFYFSLRGFGGRPDVNGLRRGSTDGETSCRESGEFSRRCRRRDGSANVKGS